MEAAKTGGSKQHQPSTPALPAATPAPPPSTRRPRVREVSSRFMSPFSSSSSSSSSAGDLHLFTSSSPKHNQTQRSVSAHRHIRQLKMADVGDENRSSETTARSLDSPFTLLSKTSKHIQPKPFKENSHRLDTPTPILPPPSRSRLSQQRLLTASAATRLLQLSVTSASSEKEGINELPTLSCRTHSKVFNSSGPSPLKPSLSSPLSSCNGRDSNSFSRSIGLSSLPPVPPNSKIPADTKKQRKVSEQLEEMHSLKLLHNRYLQWRFANANAQVKTQAQKAQTETKLCSFGLKISELRDFVERKRIELQRLTRVRTLLAITESQNPRLDQWSAIEDEYSDSLSQTIQALSISSLRLPLDSDIMVEYKELTEALVIASNVIDGITQNVGNYMSKVQEVGSLVSELARLSRGERSLTEDCGLKLLKTQAANIEEFSLRSQLIQHQKKRHV